MPVLLIVGNINQKFMNLKDAYQEKFLDDNSETVMKVYLRIVRSKIFLKLRVKKSKVKHLNYHLRLGSNK